MVVVVHLQIKDYCRRDVTDELQATFLHFSLSAHSNQTCGARAECSVLESLCLVHVPYVFNAARALMKDTYHAPASTILKRAAAVHGPHKPGLQLEVRSSGQLRRAIPNRYAELHHRPTSSLGSFSVGAIPFTLLTLQPPIFPTTSPVSSF